jgi:NAD(P)H-hydrate epimerase
MIPVLTSSEMREIDRRLIEEVGIPSLELMEAAAKGALSTLTDWLEDAKHPSVLIFCGVGNNGGDGLALARLLHGQGVDVRVQLVGDQKKFSNEARWQYDELISRGLGEIIVEFDGKSADDEKHAPPTILIDALVGNGSKGEPHEPIRSAILKLNALAARYHTRVLAIDIPSGLDSDTGVFATSADGKPVAIRADRTVTIGAPKLGFYQGDAPELTGEIRTVSLAELLPGIDDAKVHLVEKGDVLRAYPQKKFNASKFDFGRILSICGSRGMTGAAILGAEAALRSGCGLITVAVPKSQQKVVAMGLREAMTMSLSETSTGAPDQRGFEELAEQFERADVILMGCGHLPEHDTTTLHIRVIEEIEKPLVLDAGALRALHGKTWLLKSRKAPTILTPHVGELAGLLDIPREEVEKDRLGFARKFAEEHGVVVCMKGAPTYVISGEGEVFINSTGNIGLATAGSGDILAGMIAGTLAQIPTAPVQAAWIAVYHHGLAADFAQSEMTTVGMIAGDIIRHLPAAYHTVGLD